MVINLDKFEMYYLLESCFRGSHLRSSTILKFVDVWYKLFSKQQRNEYYEWILRDIYNGAFKPSPRLCGTDEIFMARYNPANQCRITIKNKTFDSFLMNGLYYIDSTTFYNKESIDKIEEI